MSALTLGLAGLTFGFTASETGGQIQDLEIVRNREKVTVRDNDGDTVAASFFDPTEEITFNFVPTGNTGIAAASPGVIAALLNYTPASGAIIVESVTINSSNTDYKKMSVKAINYPSISS